MKINDNDIKLMGYAATLLQQAIPISNNIIAIGNKTLWLKMNLSCNFNTTLAASYNTLHSVYSITKDDSVEMSLVDKVEKIDERVYNKKLILLTSPQFKSSIPTTPLETINDEYIIDPQLFESRIEKVQDHFILSEPCTNIFSNFLIKKDKKDKNVINPMKNFNITNKFLSIFFKEDGMYLLAESEKQKNERPSGNKGFEENNSDYYFSSKIIDRDKFIETENSVFDEKMLEYRIVKERFDLLLAIEANHELKYQVAIVEASAKQSKTAEVVKVKGCFIIGRSEDITIIIQLKPIN